MLDMVQIHTVLVYVKEKPLSNALTIAGATKVWGDASRSDKQADVLRNTIRRVILSGERRKYQAQATVPVPSLEQKQKWQLFTHPAARFRGRRIDPTRWHFVLLKGTCTVQLNSVA